jgi:pimeloyl-ACP methyl ester carboxylesterase
MRDDGRVQRHAAFMSLALGAFAAAAMDGSAPTGLQRNVTFAAMPGYARNGELLRRLSSPLAAQRTRRALPDPARTLAASPLDPARQDFAMYVPSVPAPANGYALLVFVPPWKDARIPTQWIPVLDATHTILVTAADSGNDANVLNRREPLALLAAYGVAQRYHVDPTRTYVGGFSGGSRVALRLALAYPDVFRGALLNAGSDPIGTAAVPLPPAALLHRFQQSSRIVFLTGDDDSVRQAQLARAGAALQQWCASNTESITLLDTGHVLADATGLRRGLAALDQSKAPDVASLDACRQRNRTQLDTELAHAAALVDGGDRTAAARLLGNIDARFGGLAAPRSVELMDQLDAQH